MIYVDVLEFENNFDLYFNKVAEDKETIMITKDGVNYVAMVPYEEYNSLLEDSGAKLPD